MYEVNDILKMLEDGKTSDEIAKSFTDSLNKAIKEKEVKDDQKKVAELKQSEKRADMINILATVKSYMKKYYPEEWEEFADMDLCDPEVLDDIIAQLDKYIQLNKNITKFVNTLFPEVKKDKIAGMTKSDPLKDPFENIFSDFFKRNGIR